MVSRFSVSVLAHVPEDEKNSTKKTTNGTSWWMASRGVEVRRKTDTIG